MLIQVNDYAVLEFGNYYKMKAMAKKKNPLVFMDVSIDGDPVERMVFEVLYILCINIFVLQLLYYTTLMHDHCVVTAFLRCCSEDGRKFPCIMYRYFEFMFDLLLEFLLF